MTAKEAYKILVEKRPELDAISCYEYETLFAFNMAPKGYDPKKANELIDCASSVNKETGLVRDFKPFHISPAEYLSGKQIKDFK